MKEIRTCIVCRKKFKKTNLNRIYQNTNREIVLDSSQKAQVRATYICFNKECHLKIYKQKILNRAFKQNIPEQDYINLAKKLKFE